MEKQVNTNVFENKIKPILLYVGTIGAISMSIGYIILMVVLVLGFKSQATLTSAITFSVVNAVVGFIIMQFLKIQGIDFAKQLDNNVKVLEEYKNWKANPQTVDKKLHSLTYYWITSVVKDLLGKGLSVAIATAGIIYIVVEGSQDYNMLLLSLVNLILFACLGLISLVKAYEFYNNEHIPYLQRLITTQPQLQTQIQIINKQLDNNVEGEISQC